MSLFINSSKLQEIYSFYLENIIIQVLQLKTASVVHLNIVLYMAYFYLWSAYIFSGFKK